MERVEEIKEIFKGSSDTVTIKEKDQSFGDWLKTAVPGDSWNIKEDQLENLEQIRLVAETALRKRNKKFRLWASVDNTLTVKAWIYDEPKPLPKWRLQKIKENEERRKKEGRYSYLAEMQKKFLATQDEDSTNIK